MNKNHRGHGISAILSVRLSSVNVTHCWYLQQGRCEPLLDQSFPVGCRGKGRHQEMSSSPSCCSKSCRCAIENRTMTSLCVCRIQQSLLPELSSTPLCQKPTGDHLHLGFNQSWKRPWSDCLSYPKHYQCQPGVRAA